MGVISFVYNTLAGLYLTIIVVYVALGWLIGFDVLSKRNVLVDAVWRTCAALVEPALRPIRKMLPHLGGIDISPVLLVVGVQALSIGLNRYVLHFLP